jgi:hypothetical protein
MVKVTERHPRMWLAPPSSTKRCANAWRGPIPAPRRRLRRGCWDADDEMVEQLKEIHVDLEDRLEGVVTA